MKKIIFVIIFVLVFVGCRAKPVLVKHSSEVSRISYAVKDSFDAARLDLAEKYTDQLYTAVTPPKDKIIIKPIYKNGKRIAIIPDKYKADEVVVLNSKEWNELSQTTEIALQLTNDNNNLKQQLAKTEAERIQQEEIKIKLSAENIQLTVDVQRLDKIIFKLKVYLFIIISSIGGYLYIKIKKILPI